MPNSYDVGDQVVCWARFRDHNTQALVNPATVVFQYRDPSLNIVTITTPSALISNPSVGYFEAVVDVDESNSSGGEPWWYRWLSTVDYKAADTSIFNAKDDPFT
jgi:hypothetical protein